MINMYISKKSIYVTYECEYTFHNSTYDFFTSHETSDFMILLIKRRGLEKNIMLWWC